MILKDTQLWDWLHYNGVVKPLLTHKHTELDGKAAISFGLSHSGVDVRCGHTVRMIRRRTLLERLLGKHILVDPKNIDEADWETIHFDKHFDIPPKTSVLVATMETFSIPEDAMAIGIGKSTYARCFVSPIITPLEAGWGRRNGGSNLTIELNNSGGHKVRIYAGEGIAQIVFFPLSGPVARPYTGAYSEQGSIPVLPRVGMSW